MSDIVVGKVHCIVGVVVGGMSLERGGVVLDSGEFPIKLQFASSAVDLAVVGEPFLNKFMEDIVCVLVGNCELLGG